MVTMGNCDCCGMIRSLHLCGDFVICDECEKLFQAGEEE